MTTFPSDCENTTAFDSYDNVQSVYLAANTKYCYSGYGFVLFGARNVKISYLNGSNWVTDVNDAFGATGKAREDYACELEEGTVFRITPTESQIVTFVTLSSSVSCQEQETEGSISRDSTEKVYMTFIDQINQRLTGSYTISTQPLKITSYETKLYFYNPNTISISATNQNAETGFFHSSNYSIHELTEQAITLTPGSGYIDVDENFSDEEEQNAFQNGGNYYFSSTITAEKISGNEQFTEKIVELKPETIYTYSMPDSQIADFSEKSEEEGLAAWKIALIVVGGVVGAGLIGFCIYFFTCRKKPVEAQDP